MSNMHNFGKKVSCHLNAPYLEYENFSKGPSQTDKAPPKRPRDSKNGGEGPSKNGTKKYYFGVNKFRAYQFVSYNCWKLFNCIYVTDKFHTANYNTFTKIKQIFN
eukprot:TRINITY_DN4581_c0_g1_i4.p4 TRINITY_DN4581_c0_g1~~TRINITY_DN4581_c0_g1_i4.p4  ORF type:complete len:105 (+),score=2.00 TRINITY_DN4581_c0_g1_i4:464-778(+)